MRHLIAKISKLELQPGDIIVLTLNRLRTPAETRLLETLPDYIRKTFGRPVPVIVLDDTMTIGTLPAEKLRELVQKLDAEKP